MKVNTRFFQTTPLIGKIMVGLFLLTGLFVNAQTPVAYYPLNGNANDLSGNILNGTIVGTVTPVADRFGNPNSAMSFPGSTGSFIQIADNPLLRPTSITISCWVNVSGGGLNTFIHKAISPCVNDSWFVGTESGNFRSYVSNSFVCGDQINLSSAQINNQWKFVAFAVDANNDTRSLYIDGVQVATGAYTSNLQYDGNPVTLGAGFENGIMSFPLSGSLDEVKIYNTALTAAQIMEDMGNIPLPTAVCCGGSNAGCSSSSANNMNGGSASGFGCGGGGAGYFGGHGGNGLYGGGGGGAAGFNQPNRSGGAGGTGVVVVEMLNAQNELVERNAYTGGSSFVVPANVTSAHVWAIGAGGGGAGATGSDGTSGGGGGAGGVAYKSFNVNSGDIFTYTLGVAGAGGVDASDGNAGTNTTVTFNSTTLIGGGGEGGKYNTNIDAQGGTFSGGDGGSNGGNGKGAASDSGGGAGGGIGLSANLSISCAGGVGANANDVAGLFEVLTAQQVLLIANYHFNGNAADMSGNDLHGTIVGSPTFSTDRNGLANGAILFDGNVANRIEVDDNLLLHTPSITISAWVKFNNLSYLQSIVDKPLGLGISDSWHFGTENSNASVWHFNNTGSSPYSQITSPVNTGQWYYIVNTFDNDSKLHKLYIDGVLKSTITFNSTIGYDNSKMYIGAAIENGGLNFPMNGVVDEVKIYSTALSAVQVQQEFTASAPAINYASQFGNSVLLNGTNDFVDCGNNSALNITTNLTLEAWIKPTAFGVLRQILHKGGGANADREGFQLRIDGGTSAAIVIANGSSLDAVNITFSNSDLNKWMHIAGVYDGSTLKIYRNGILAGSKSTTQTLTHNALPLIIGKRSDGFNFEGSIDEVRIWNTARTQTEIQTNMNAQLTGTETGLVGYWDMNRNGQGAGLILDNKAITTGAALNGTTFGTVSSPVFVPGTTPEPNYASQFGNTVLLNGSNDHINIPFNGNTLTQLTIEFWFKKGNGADAGIMQWASDNLSSAFPWILLRDYGTSVTLLSDDGYRMSAVGLTTGTWYHMAVTFDGANWKMMLNGNLTGSSAAGIGVRSSTNIHLGNGYPTFWNGSLDEVRIWNIARTQAEIQTNMNTQLAGTETGLVGYWDMNRNGQGAGLIVDNEATATGAALNGTTLGTGSTPVFAPAVAQQAPGSGNALSFDGVDDFISIPNGGALNGLQSGTFECWVKYDNTTQGELAGNFGCISGRQSDGNFSNQILALNGPDPNTASLKWCAYTYNPTIQTSTSPGTGWNHIAVTYSSGDHKMYMNGVLIGTSNATGSIGSGNVPLTIGKWYVAHLKGNIDEVRIWNTLLTESQIRDRMCQKITSSDPLYSNLVAYYNFDESTGNTAFDGSVNANNGALVNGPTRLTSGAAIGNTSAHSYAGASSSINLAHPTRGDDLTATLISGAAAGIQVYNVNEEPNTRSGVSGLATNNVYFGTFVVGGSSPTLNAVYNYDGIPNIVSEGGLALFGRNNNSITTWNAENAVINTTANTLSLNGITGNQKELIVGENSPGTISASQSSCLAIVPDPLTGTAAFNGVPGVTYQWQDSIVGGTWTNIPGATNGTTYAPPLLNSPKYFRRLATFNALTIPSNEVFLDIRGAVPASTVPVNQWNVYAYNGTDLNLGAGTTYQGYYSVSGLVVNSESLWNQNAAPSTAPGYKGCEVNQAPWTLAVKRQGFPNGNYVLNITSVDNGVRAYLNGNEIFAAGGFGPYNNITLGALNSSSVIEVRAENSGGPGYLNFNLQTSALQGGTISANQSNCGSFIPALLNNVNSAFGGSLLNITYQWQQSPNNVSFTDISGATSGTYQPVSVSSDTYFRRKASNANNETAFSNTVFIDITGITYYADTDGDGFGDPNNTIIACSLPPGYLTNNTDCNDTDPLQRPGQVWYTDMDNDGYVSSNGPGQPALTITQCSRPAGGKVAAELVTTVGRDCDDNDPTINPLAQRLTISSSPDFANGVYPLLGDPSTTFFFEALYFDDNNALPSITFPRAYLDFESNNFINEPQDRIVILSEFDAADQNTVDGKKYVGSISGLPNGNTWQTFLISEYSNTCQRGTGPFPHPDVLLQPNVQIFANDIEFSDENPPVSSPVTITAHVGNPSDFAVQNVVVRMRNQAEPNTVYPDITIPYIAAHTSGVASWNITTPAFNGLCPMQVTVDFTNSIVETNELDNVAVSSFNNGGLPLSGDIIVEANVVPATSYASANNTLHLNFNAAFNGTSLPAELKVAGALVTFQIDETGATFTGFTSANGNIYIPFTAPVSPGVYHISGTVSSPPFTGFINPNITTFELINGNDPDFTVTLTATDVTCLAGQSVGHTIVVNNNGLVASTVNTQLTLSIPGGNPSLLTFVVPPISAGGSHTIPDVNVQFPAAGTYTVCAQADALQEINELNESNNSGCLNIVAVVAAPDLEVISGSSGPQTICIPVVLSASIRNSGGVSAAASTSRMVVKLGNTTIQTFNHAVPALGPSEVHSYAQTFIPSVTGIYTYSVEADFNQVVTEASESNNINTFTITVTPCLPDLVAGNCDLAATSATNYASGNMTLSATIFNDGETATSLPITVRFQFSNNTFVNAVHSGVIPKGQSVTVTATVAAFVNPGVTMKAIVDPNNTIAELNEANNESFPKPTAWDLAFTGSVDGCGPDLTNFSYKPFFSYYLPVKIANYSLYTAANVKVKYQISGPGLIGTVTLATAEAVDVITNCVVCPQGVSLPSPFVFPQPGTYTITLTIDPDNEYTEVNEGNNVRVVTVEVSNKPDMRIVSSFINPTLLNPAIGEPITVSVTYDNIGSSNVSDLMKLKLFIDNVAIETVSGLSGLATNNYATVNFTIPWSSTVPGTHVIKAFIDSDNGIVENDEDNNIATRAVTVGSSANLWVKSLSVLNYYPDLNDNINIRTKIENQGDLPTNAVVSVFYVNNSLDSVLIAAQSVSLPGNDSISLVIPWIVVDNKTKIVVVISNSSALEYNYSDNTAFIELGKMALFLEAFPACETGNKGTMTAYINGGEPPYTYAWSNGSATKSITAAADAYSVTVFDATGQQVSGSDVIPPCTGMLLKVKCYLQGYYISQGLMASVLTQSGINSPLEYTDTITVRLHATTFGFPMIVSSKAILHSNGTVTCEFPASQLGSNRFIVLEHRNSIETWSAAPVLISNSMMYDFSNAVNKAYGNNLQLMSVGVYAIYGGDVNQDGAVDTGDMTPVDNDAAEYSAGYLPTDANGDGIVDTADITIIDNNGADYVTSARP